MKKPAAFIDILFLLVFMLLVLPHNPEMESKTTRPGTILFEIRWPDGLDIDVDLWVETPEDGPVGYSRRAGNFANLLRDDLGSSRDTLSLNYENIYTRGAPEGEYIVNVHLYSARDKLPVNIQVQVTKQDNQKTQFIFSKTVTLTQIGEQITVNRFTLDKNGLVKGSIHDLPKDLR